MLRTLLTTAALGLATFASAEVTLNTYKGEATIEGSPETIAVYDIAAIDTLVALGVTPQATVQPLYVDYLADLETQNVGSLFEPDLEALNAVQPDLVIVGGRSSSKLEDVARVAPAIDMTIWGDVVTQGLQRMDTYAALFGKEDKAAELKAAFEAKRAETATALQGKGGALILMTNGPDVSAYGPNGRFAWIYNTLGVEAAAEIADSNHGEAISFEFVRDVNPGVLLVLDRLAAIGRDGEAAAAVLDNALVRETDAWKNGNVIYLDSGAAYIAAGGIQGLNKVLDSVLSAASGS